MKNIKLNFMVDEKLARELKEVANEFEVTISKLIRKVLKIYLENRS